MSYIRITKEFRFETSHMLKDYDGLCVNNHGHSYKLLVTVSGIINADLNSPKLGMLIDFGDLKTIVNEEIVDRFDHSLVVNAETPQEIREKMEAITNRLIFTPYQPTCENMVSDFARLIRGRLPKNVSLHHLRLYETANSYAEWYASDNQLL